MNTTRPCAALYRGRFDPPGLHHIDTIRALLERFDRVVVLPWGPVGHRSIDENVAPVFRARLIDLAFGKLGPRVVVDLHDIEHATATPSRELEETLPGLRDHDVAHVVEADTYAEDRARLHDGARVIVVAPTGAPVPDGHSDVVRVENDVPGAVMRKRFYEGAPVADLVPHDVAAVIARHGLYRGVPRVTTRVAVTEPRLLLVVDERNEKAVRWAERFRPWAVETDPNLIVVFGGDGSMLHAIQQHWRKRVPFFGINAGHIGFLLNDAAAVLGAGANGNGGDPRALEALWPEQLVVHHLPMLHVELLGQDGAWRSGLTFNDAWIERATGQSAWLEVAVDGRVRFEKMVCDGVLVSTAAGSTAYARSMGASPLLADTPAWLLVGSHVMDPISWKSALLSPSSTVSVRALGGDKRPINGYLHGLSMGLVTAMNARMSRAASVELAFLAQHDMAEKIARVQFPT